MNIGPSLVATALGKEVINSHEHLSPERPSLQGISITHVTNNDNAGKKYALHNLLTMPGLGETLSSFFLPDAEGSEKRNSEEVEKVFKELQQNYPAQFNQLSINSFWEKSAAIEKELPPGTLEPLKGLLRASAIRKRTSSAQKIALGKMITPPQTVGTGAILNTENRKAFFLSEHFLEKGENANEKLKKTELLATAIERLSEKKGFYLKYGAHLKEMGLDQVANQLVTSSQEIDKVMDTVEQLAEAIGPQDKRAQADLLETKALALEHDVLALLQASIENLTIHYNERSYFATTQRNIAQASLFSQMATRANAAASSFKKAIEAITLGNKEAAHAYELSAQYYLQSTQTAHTSGTLDEIATSNFYNAALSAQKAGDFLTQAAQVKTQGDQQATQIYHLLADNRLQQAKAYSTERATLVPSLNSLNKIYLSLCAAETQWKETTQTKIQKNQQATQASELSVQCYLLTAHALIQGDLPMSLSFGKAAAQAEQAAESFKKAAAARAEGNKTIMLDFEEQAQYCLAQAKIFASAGEAEGDAYTKEKHLEKIR